MIRANRRRVRSGPALAALLALAGAGLSACAEDEALDPFPAPQIPDIRGPDDLRDPYVGLLDAEFREKLDSYARLEVTLLAEVTESLAPQAFLAASPEDGDAEPVLVVATADAGDVEAEAGEPLFIAATPVQDFDAEVVIEELGLDIDPALLQEWDGETFLVATILEPAP